MKLSKWTLVAIVAISLKELPVGRSALSAHLKELKFAGLIQGEIESIY